MKVVKYSLYVVLTLFCLYLLCGFILIPYFVKSYATSYISQKDGNLSIEKVDFNPLNFHLNIKDLNLSSNKELVKFSDLSMDIKPFEIFSRVLHVDNVRIENLFLDYEIFENNQDSFSFLLDESNNDENNQTSDFKYKITNFTSLNAILNYKDKANKLSFKNSSDFKELFYDTNLSINNAKIKLHEISLKSNNKIFLQDLNVDFSSLKSDFKNADLNDLNIDANALEYSDKDTLAKIKNLKSSFDNFSFKNNQIFGIFSSKMSEFSMKFEKNKADFSDLSLQDTGLFFDVNKNILDFNSTLQMKKINFKNDILSANSNALNLKNINLELTKNVKISLKQGDLESINSKYKNSSFNIKKFDLSNLNFNGNDLVLQKTNADNIDIFIDLKDFDSQDSGKSDFVYKINDLNVKNANVKIKDEISTNSVKSINLSAKNITPKDTFAFEVKINDDNLKAELNGDLNMDKMTVEMKSKANLSNVNVFLPYVKEYVKISDLNGKIDFNADVQYDKNLKIQGLIKANNFVVKDEKNKLLAGFKQLDTNVYFNKNDLKLSKLNLNESKFSLVINKNNELEILNLFKNNNKTAEKSDKKNQKNDFNFEINGFNLKNGSFEFSDETMPFKTTITRINANINKIVNNKKSDLNFRAILPQGGFSQVSVSGYAFNPELNSTLSLKFRNFGLLAIQPYLEKYLGYEIKEGKLNLDLNYDVVGGKIKGTNNINIDNIELGDEKPSQYALDLPLKLALYILKDSENQIDLDLGISGDMQDPDFSYGKIVTQAVMKLMGDIVSSPFRFIGGLFASNDEIVVRFPHGISMPIDSNVTKYAQLAKLKPEIIFDLVPTYNEKTDASAMAKMKIEREILDFVDKENTTYENAVKTLFSKANLGEFIDEVSAKEALININKISQEMLVELANKRVLRFKDMLLKQGVLESQISINKVKNSGNSDDRNVKMLINLKMK